jgi:ribose/xylose/arabinose/galactoside ABC-type transport system permease subunit
MLYRGIGLIVITISIVVLSTTSIDSALSVIQNLLKTAPALIVISLAAGLVISCGQIDIASGSLLGLTGMIIFVVLYASAANPHLPSYSASIEFRIVMVCVAWVFAISIYFLMGYLISHFGIPALLCTLAVLFAGRSLSILAQNWIKGSFSDLGREGTLSLPPSLQITLFEFGWIWVALVCTALVVWRYFTDAGLRHVAVGMDERAARFAGIDTKMVQLLAYAIAGFLVGLGAHLTLYGIHHGTWAGNVGWGLELSAIAAAIIGGCRITGGRFDPLCIAMGAVFIRTLEDAAGSLDIPSEFFYIFVGLGLLVAAILDRVTGVPVIR